MAPPDTSGLADGTAIVEVNVPGVLSPQARMGERAFNAECAACHGANAAGNEGQGPPLVHRIYEPGHHSDMAFVLAAKNGVRAHHWRYGNMPPVSGVTDADVKAITAYVRALQKENGIF
ncbi:MAG TPA: cytochrome c [Roseovarius sp.]|nr:cytochrome c [Roseovarius sp.]